MHHALRAEVDRHDQHDEQLRRGGGRGCNEAHNRALANADHVQQGQSAECDQRAGNRITPPDCGHDHREVGDAGEGADRGRQVVVDDDEKSADQAGERMQGPRGKGHHAAAFGVAPRDLGVFQGEQDEGDKGHEDEDRRPFVVAAGREDARHVIDRRADIGEDDGPAKQRAQACAVELDAPPDGGGRMQGGRDHVPNLGSAV